VNGHGSGFYGALLLDREGVFGRVEGMPSIEQNLEGWNQTCPWTEHGDEWSGAFGNTEAMWWFALLPRLHRYVPADSILEIAPGHGRWTQYLRFLCKSLVIVDLSENCIAACRKRFENASNITYMVNDGLSFDTVPDNSLDLIFSFDSLVHCEKDVIAAYLKETVRTLKPDGVGFFHHSNIGVYRHLLDIFNALPSSYLKRAFSRLVSLNCLGWRAPSMSAVTFRELCEDANLDCISQELINWSKGRCMIDAISVCTPRGSKWSRQCEALMNPRFVEAASNINRLSRLYSRP
jgi:SAM-dependent methyltransferase